MTEQPTTAGVVPYIPAPPSITHDGGVFSVALQSGDRRIELAMSAKTTKQFRDRLSIALDRYAMGEEHIIVNG